MELMKTEEKRRKEAKKQEEKDAREKAKQEWEKMRTMLIVGYQENK